MYACLTDDPDTSYDFWKGQLGFETTKHTVPFEHYKEFVVGNDTFTVQAPKMINGVHTTTATHTINGLTKKKSNSYLQIPAEPAYAPGKSPYEYVESNNNEVIFADNITVTTIDNSRTSSGYFFIEMVAGFNTFMVSDKQTSQNIHAVVNRYYNRGAYTSSTEADSVVYTHKGAPLILSSMRTRILLPNRTVPQNLGEDNTIFLEVIKQPPNPQQIKQQLQEEKK